MRQYLVVSKLAICLRRVMIGTCEWKIYCNSSRASTKIQISSFFSGYQMLPKEILKSSSGCLGFNAPKCDLYTKSTECFPGVWGVLSRKIWNSSPLVDDSISIFLATSESLFSISPKPGGINGLMARLVSADTHCYSTPQRSIPEGCQTHVTLKLHEHKAKKRKDPWEMNFRKSH